MQHIDPDHHDGTSDATPGGEPDKRRPGELVFALVMLLASLFLLNSAYGIAGFDALSSPGAIPMATTAAMVLSAAVILWNTAKLPLDRTESLIKDILPLTVVMFALFLVAFGFLLKPLGFLPTSALFLIAAIKILGKRSWGWTVGIAVFSLVVVWLIFRIVFTVLMPAGIVPEAELIQIFRNVFAGGAQ